MEVLISATQNVEVDPGDVVVLDTRDALDGHLNPQSTLADFSSPEDIFVSG